MRMRTKTVMEQMNAEKPDDVLAELEAKHGRPPATCSADLPEIIRAIKMTALSMKEADAYRGLQLIVRLCINAEKATGTYVPADKRNLTIKRLSRDHDCDVKIRESHWAMSGYRQDGDRWRCSCGQVYAFVNDEAEGGGGWWPQNTEVRRSAKN